ncbi:hypothetical protein LTR85_011540 [Meristemomyces frigidus]|nr:hypothetical protein LTR85_011540 [Meristemomyces frigidus]
MDFLTSGLKTGLLIAATVIGLASLLSGIWFAGCYLGRPLGSLIVRILGLRAEWAQKSEAESAALEAKVSRVLGGILTFFLCVVAVVIEVGLQEQRTLSGAEERIGWVGAIALVSKGCFEGMVALGVVAAVVRVLRLA